MVWGVERCIAHTYAYLRHYEHTYTASQKLSFIWHGIEHEEEERKN